MPNGPGQTVTAPEERPLFPTELTETTKPAPAQRGPLPYLHPSPLLARFWIELPFDEAAWPHAEVGGPLPARVERVNVPWVEDLEGRPLTRDQFMSAVMERFSEINSESTVEGSEEVEFAGIFPVELGSAVRSVVLSFGPGGSRPTVRVSGSSLMSRRFPFMRAMGAFVATVAAARPPAPPPPAPEEGM